MVTTISVHTASTWSARVAYGREPERPVILSNRLRTEAGPPSFSPGFSRKSCRVARVETIDDRDERFHQVLALPAGAHVLPQDRERLGRRYLVLIRPRRGQCFVRVDDADDL